MDPALDGFGHHNPELTQPDNLWRDTMAIDRMIEGLFRGRDLSANEVQFMRLIRMGICHEHGIFPVFFKLLSNTYNPSSFTFSSYPINKITLVPSISSSHFISEPQEKQKRSVLKSNTRLKNTTNTTDSPFTNALIHEDYLEVRGKIYWLSHLLQDRRSGTIAHQRAHQGVSFHGIDWDHQLKMA